MVNEPRPVLWVAKPEPGRRARFDNERRAPYPERLRLSFERARIPRGPPWKVQPPTVLQGDARERDQRPDVDTLPGEQSTNRSQHSQASLGQLISRVRLAGDQAIPRCRTDDVCGEPRQIHPPPDPDARLHEYSLGPCCSKLRVRLYRLSSGCEPSSGGVVPVGNDRAGDARR